MHEHKRSRIMRSWSVPANCGILGDRKSTTLTHRRRMTFACAHTVQWCAVAPEASQFPWRQELCDASAPLLVRARAKCVALQPARFRASARPSRALTTVPHITAAQAASQRARGAASAGAKAAATRAAPLVLPSPPPQSTRRGSARNLKRA
jgi:hypothetical protein